MHEQACVQQKYFVTFASDREPNTEVSTTGVFILALKQAPMDVHTLENI